MKINLWSWIGKSFLNKTHKSLKKKRKEIRSELWKFKNFCRRYFPQT